MVLIVLKIKGLYILTIISDDWRTSPDYRKPPKKNTSDCNPHACSWPAAAKRAWVASKCTVHALFWTVWNTGFLVLRPILWNSTPPHTHTHTPTRLVEGFPVSKAMAASLKLGKRSSHVGLTEIKAAKRVNIHSVPMPVSSWTKRIQKRSAGSQHF